MLRKRVVEQEERIEELERQVNRSSRNSSQPPSQDSPKSRAQRRREAREKLKALSESKRKPGGQPGIRASIGRWPRRNVLISAASICRGCARAGIGLMAASSRPVIRWFISSGSLRRSAR